ncbi:MAG: hypothetical protein WBR29_13115 [Gammaproteobacteria bacterium]
MTWGNPKRTNWNIPEDARIVQEDDSWSIYHSAAHARLYIYPASYHVQSLPLNTADLQRLLHILGAAPGPSQDDETAPIARPKIPPSALT